MLFDNTLIAFCGPSFFLIAMRCFEKFVSFLKRDCGSAMCAESSLREDFLRLGACLRKSDDAVTPKRRELTTFAVHEHERFCAAWTHAQTEPGEALIKIRMLPLAGF